MTQIVITKTITKTVTLTGQELEQLLIENYGLDSDTKVEFDCSHYRVSGVTLTHKEEVKE